MTGAYIRSLAFPFTLGKGRGRPGEEAIQNTHLDEIGPLAFDIE